MNKNLTIVLVCYFTHKIINKVLKSLKNYKVIIIENSLDNNLKETLKSIDNDDDHDSNNGVDIDEETKENERE